MLQEPYLLLIEDNPDDVFFFRRYLEKLARPPGLVVLASGDEALRFMTGAGTGALAKPFLVLLDLNLPQLHGLVVLQLFKANGWLKRVPVVAMSYSEEAVMGIESKALGATSFMQKPLSADDLAELLDRYLPLAGDAQD